MCNQPTPVSSRDWQVFWASPHTDMRAVWLYQASPLVPTNGALVAARPYHAGGQRMATMSASRPISLATVMLSRAHFRLVTWAPSSKTITLANLSRSTAKGKAGGTKKVPFSLPGRSKEGILPTEILLEGTDGLRRAH